MALAHQASILLHLARSRLVPLLTVLDSALSSELQGNTRLLRSVFWQILEQAFRYFPFKGFSADLRPVFKSPEL